MRNKVPESVRRRFARHLPDACLVAALLVVLALSLESVPSSRTDLVEAAREAVARQVGAPGSGPAVASGDEPAANVGAAPAPG